MAWKKLDEAASLATDGDQRRRTDVRPHLLALKDRTNDDLTAVEAFRQAADDPSSLPENGWPERLASALAGRFAAAGNGEAGQKEHLLSDVIDVMQQMHHKLPAQLRPTVDPHYGRLLHRQIERLLVAVEAPADFQRLLDACQVYADQIGVSGPPDPLVVACRAECIGETTAGDSGWVQVRHLARETANLIDRQDIAMDADASAYVRYVAVIADSHGLGRNQGGRGCRSSARGSLFDRASPGQLAHGTAAAAAFCAGSSSLRQTNCGRVCRCRHPALNGPRPTWLSPT